MVQSDFQCNLTPLQIKIYCSKNVKFGWNSICFRIWRVKKFCYFEFPKDRIDRPASRFQQSLSVFIIIGIIISSSPPPIHSECNTADLTMPFSMCWRIDISPATRIHFSDFLLQFPKPDDSSSYFLRRKTTRISWKQLYTHKSECDAATRFETGSLTLEIRLDRGSRQGQKDRKEADKRG